MVVKSIQDLVLTEENLLKIISQITPQHEIVKFEKCVMQLSSLKALLQLSQLREIQFVETELDFTSASQLALDLLELNSNIKIDYQPPETLKTSHVSYATPIWYYQALLNWQKSCWLEATEKLTEDVQAAIKQFQTAVKKAVLVQMNFYRVVGLYSTQFEAFLFNPAFSNVIQDAYFLENDLKQLARKCARNAPGIFLQMVESLQKDIHLYLPDDKPSSDVEIFQYYMLLDHYLKLRLVLPFESYQIHKTQIYNFPIGMHNYIVRMAESLNPVYPPLQSLLLALTLYCQELTIIPIEVLSHAEKILLQVKMNFLGNLIEANIKQFEKSPQKIVNFHPDILLGLLAYISFLDKKLIQFYDIQTHRKIIQCTKLVLQCATLGENRTIDNFVFMRLLVELSRPEKSDCRSTGQYFFEINQLLRPYFNKVQVKMITVTPLPIAGIRAQQFWLLDRLVEINAIFILGIVERLTANHENFLYGPAFYHLKYRNKRAVSCSKVLAWDTKQCTPPFEPPARNKLLDLDAEYSHRRILFEKILFYLFNNLKQLPDYIEQMRSLTKNLLESLYPSMVLAANSILITCHENVYQEQQSNLQHLLLATFAILCTPTTSEFKIPAIGSLRGHKNSTIQHTEQILELLSQVCSNLLLDKSTTEFALQNKLSHQKVLTLCQTRSTQLKQAVITLAEQVKQNELQIWKLFSETHRPVPYKQKRAKRLMVTTSKPTEKKVIPASTISIESEVTLPSYIEKYPQLKPIHLDMDRKSYASSMKSADLLLKEYRGADNLAITNHPIIAYLYYAIAESLRMQKKRVETSVIFDYLYRGYELAQEFFKLSLEIDSELTDILNFLIDEVEDSTYLKVATTPNIPQQLSNQYLIEIPENTLRLQQKLFTIINPEKQFFYGSFVAISLIAIIHPDSPKLAYSDIDIVIFTDRYQETLEFVSNLLHCIESTNRTGCFRGTFEKMRYDIQIYDEQHMNEEKFANTLGIGARSGMATHLGQVRDPTKQAIAHIRAKLTRFLKSTDLEKNHTAIFMHLRTQAQFGFCSNEEDDVVLLKNHAQVLKLPAWLLRDFFSRHLQSGYAQKIFLLWKKYQLLNAVWPELTIAPEKSLNDECKALDDLYLKIKKCPYPIIYLLAQFMKLIVAHDQQYFMNQSAPILKELPDIAAQNLNDSVFYGLRTQGYFKDAVTIDQAGAQQTSSTSTTIKSLEL